MYLAILSGVLLALAYPVFNLESFAFVAFVPLFFALKNVSPVRALFLAYLTGIIFWAITIYWLIHVTLLGLILLVLYLSLYFGLFGLFFVGAPLAGAQKNRAATRAAPTCNVVLISSAWVFLEYLRSHLLTGFPWALLGYSQYLNLPFIQIADITGVWGVSFIVMMVNAAIYGRISRARSPTAPIYGGLFGEQALQILLPLVLLCFSFGYGYYRLHLSAIRYPLNAVKISLIQGNIPQRQKWDKNFRESILGRYEALTREAAKDKPDLIIWPETAVPGVIGEEPELLERVSRLARAVNRPLLIGTTTAKIITHHPPLITHYYNSAILISSEGKVLRQYDKLHLVPFGEYVPLERYFPFLRELIGVPIGDFTAGKKYAIFEIASLAPAGLARNDNVNFAVLICFEDIMPGLSRRFVKDGARFLVNITNDAWFEESSAPYQHAAASVFRAVENRAPVVRAANTGLSCFIDASGRIYDKVSDGNKDIFVVGYRTGIITIHNVGAGLAPALINHEDISDQLKPAKKRQQRDPA